MVAVMKTSSRLRDVINYNENKVKQRHAELIHSNNYLKDTDQLNFTDKIGTIERNTKLNQMSKLNIVHISLNFDPSENISKDRLQQIADSYMQQIGFGEQPYLVYQHHDAGHPHMHIVTTNIQWDGSRIKMHNICRNQSESARKQIEAYFKLIPATRNTPKQSNDIKPVNAQKVQYGKMETRRAITNVLDAVLTNYKYTSVPELNAVLTQYNIFADRGAEGSRIYKNNGLVYRVLNEKGKKVGTPIKASDIYNKPGLKFLEKQFAKNESLKQPHQLRVKNAIDFTLLRRSPTTIEALRNTLLKESITLVVQQNEQGVVYGLTFIDHQNKCVFNGSDIGKAYGPTEILNRLGQEQRQLVGKDQGIVLSKKVTGQDQFGIDNNTPLKIQSTLSGFVNEIIKPEREGALAGELKQDQINWRRKKKIRQ